MPCEAVCSGRRSTEPIPREATRSPKTQTFRWEHSLPCFLHHSKSIFYHSSRGLRHTLHKIFRICHEISLLTLLTNIIRPYGHIVIFEIILPHFHSFVKDIFKYFRFFLLYFYFHQNRLQIARQIAAFLIFYSFKNAKKINFFTKKRTFLKKTLDKPANREYNV